MAAATATTVTVSGGGGPVKADGTFTLTGITPGRYRLSLGLPSPATPRWMVAAATLGGQDALDAAIDVRQSVGDAIITVTDRLTELNGRIDGVNGADYTIVVFPQNHADWAMPSRRILTSRTAKDGTFTFKRLPPGDYSLAAIDDVEPGEWFDPAFLQRIEPTAIKVSIGDGETKTQDIRAAGGG
jgi:hypothetical protein